MGGDARKNRARRDEKTDFTLSLLPGLAGVWSHRAALEECAPVAPNCDHNFESGYS